MDGSTFRTRLRAVREPRGFTPLLAVAACVPAVVAVAAMGSDILRDTRFFGSNPIKHGEHFLGDWTLRFLLLTLAVTPVRQLTGWNWLAKHRRTLGLFAFAYVMLHWLTYALLDVQLDWGDLTKDLAKRPYIMIGMAGLVCMMPLALTSTKGMIRRLGGARWNRLHRLAYVVPVLGTIHFWMSVKKDVTEPLLYALGFAVLFAWRLARRSRRAAAAPA